MWYSTQLGRNDEYFGTRLCCPGAGVRPRRLGTVFPVRGKENSKEIGMVYEGSLKKSKEIV